MRQLFKALEKKDCPTVVLAQFFAFLTPFYVHCFPNYASQLISTNVPVYPVSFEALSNSIDQVISWSDHAIKTLFFRGSHAIRYFTPDQLPKLVLPTPLPHFSNWMSEYPLFCCFKQWNRINHFHDVLCYLTYVRFHKAFCSYKEGKKLTVSFTDRYIGNDIRWGFPWTSLEP